jgi:hypothetical protein
MVYIGQGNGACSGTFNGGQSSILWQWLFMHPQVRLRKSDEEFDMDQYLVESHRGTWKIKYEGSYIAVLPTRATAIRWAIDRAQNARARSVEARVLVQDEDRVFRVEWTNSRGGGWGSAA